MIKEKQPKLHRLDHCFMKYFQYDIFIQSQLYITQHTNFVFN